MLVHEIPLQRFLPRLERAEPLIKDHTAVKTFMECPRKYFYRMVCGREARKPEMAVIFGWGLAIHKFMELLYKGESPQEALRAANSLYIQPDMATKKNWSHLDGERFLLTLELLLKFYENEKKEGFVKTLAVEQPFNADFPDGLQCGGRFDALTTQAGRDYVRDWKTTTKQAMWFVENLDPNDQATRYVWGRSRIKGWRSDTPSIGMKADGVEFVVISNQAPTKEKKNLPVITKHLISRSDDQLKAFESEQVAIHQQIDVCRDSDVWPMHPLNCQWCDFKKVCRTPTDGSREYLLQTEFVHSPWNHQTVDQKEKVEL